MKLDLLTCALSLSLIGSALAQNDNGHLSVRYPYGVRTTDVAAYCRTLLPKLCDHSTFEMADDHTDHHGMRHLTLQQYVDGMRVNGKSLLVHMRQGAICSIQGDVLTQQMAATSDLHRRAPQRAADVLQQAGLSQQQAVEKEVQLQMIGGVCRQVYTVRSGIYYFTLDAVSGEVLDQVSLVRNLTGVNNDLSGMTPVDGTAQTYFSGLQPIRCAQVSDSLFVLADPDRKIRVCDASSQALSASGYSLSQQNRIFFESYFLENSDLLRQFLDDCPLYTNRTSQWTDTTFDFAWDGMTYVAGSNTMGKHVYAAFVDHDVIINSSDIVLITDEETPLHLTYAPDYDLTEVYLYTYDPETATSKEIADNLISRQCNAQIVARRTVTYDSLSYIRYLDAVSKDGMLVLLNRMVGSQPCTDVLWGMEKTYDYYLQTFGLDSFDGRGTELYCLCNPPQCIITGSNACALPLVDKNMPGIMIFGMGNSWGVHPRVQLNIIGHEFTHLVGRKLSSYYRESETCHCCALNESFADIMSLAILHFATGYEGWTVGEGENRLADMLPGERCFDHPEEYGHPSCYGDENFDTRIYEQHTNAGVQNHMFYLLVTGGEGVNTLGQDYNVSSMDRTEAEDLAYTVLTEYTRAPMTYRDAAEAWASAASGIYGENSAQLQSVMQAWAAVGLPLDTVIGIDLISHDRQALGLRYNLMGQPVGTDYVGLCIER